MNKFLVVRWVWVLNQILVIPIQIFLGKIYNTPTPWFLEKVVLSKIRVNQVSEYNMKSIMRASEGISIS